jgi:hypothetical protein
MNELAEQAEGCCSCDIAVLRICRFIRVLPTTVELNNKKPNYLGKWVFNLESWIF